MSRKACAWTSIRSSGLRKALPADAPGLSAPARTSGRLSLPFVITMETIAEAARFLEVPLGLVQAAVTYYGAYTGEIDHWIEANEQEATEAHDAWVAGKAAVQR